MLRLVLRRTLLTTRLPSSQVAVTAVIRGPRFTTVRYESTQEPSLKELRERVQADWVAPKLTYAEVKKRTQEPTEDAYLIDVREPDEVAQGAIPSSVSLPLSTLSSSLHLRGDEFLNKHGFMKPAYNQEIVFYCRSGKRSATACDVARRNGYTKVINYEGSWLDWVQKSRSKLAS